MKILLVVLALMLSGCASQQWAQTHWGWLSANKGITPSYSSGVSITNYTVNGQSYQVIAPQR